MRCAKNIVDVCKLSGFKCKKRPGAIPLHSAYLLAPLLVLLVGCGPEEYAWNQRLTVTVQTPDGPVTGTSVYRMFATLYGPDGQAITGSTARFGYRGENAVVDLGEGRFIFVDLLISGDTLFSLAPDRYDGLSIQDRDEWLPLALERREPFILPEDRYPRLITFGDITDPLTANIFEVGEMEAIFGEGYRIASMEWQVVDDAPTSGRVLEVLPWLLDVWPNQLDGDTGRYANAEFPEANQLGAGSFSNDLRRLIEE